MTAALLDLVYSAVVMTHPLAGSWPRARHQGTRGFDEGERAQAWETPGVDAEGMWENPQQGSSMGPGSHPEQGRSKEKIGMKLDLDFGWSGPPAICPWAGSVLNCLS